MSDDLLTKDNFNYQYSGDSKHWNWELAHHPRYTKPWTEQEAKDIRDQILKNQEMAKQWQIYLDGGLNNLLEIVEHLKKYLKNIDADILDKEKIHLCDEYGCEDRVRDAIQKILGGEK